MIDINNTSTDDLKNLRLHITAEISARTKREYEDLRNQRRKAERVAKKLTSTESTMPERRKANNRERQRRFRKAKKVTK